MSKIKILIIILICFSNASLIYSQIENSNMIELNCATWGKDITVNGESRHREDDPNIILMNGSMNFNYQYFGDEITVRWMIKDTTIFYNIIVQDLVNLEKIYTTTSNKVCGLTINIKGIYDESYQTDYLIEIKREKKFNTMYYHGASFYMGPISERERNQLNEKLKNIQKQSSNQVEADLTSADFAFQSGFSLDALSFLEHAIKEKPHDKLTTKKYWSMIDIIRIKKP